MVHWLLVAAILLLFVIYISHPHYRTYMLEPFFDMTSTTALKESKDFLIFQEFHNNQFCPVWNQMIETASKNDQASLPADQQVDTFKYMKQMETAWNVMRVPPVIFVNCTVPIDVGTVPRALLQIMPKDGQPYVDTLTFMNTKLDLIQKQVQEAISGISTGEIPTISTESFVGSQQLLVNCTIDDSGNMNCTDASNSVSCSNSPPLTPEEQAAQAIEVDDVLKRAKTINATIPNLKSQLKKAQTSMTSLKKTKADAESGAIYGVQQQQRKPKPPTGHLFYS